MPERVVAARARPSRYPADLAALIGARKTRRLGARFGLVELGVTLARLTSDAVAARRTA